MTVVSARATRSDKRNAATRVEPEVEIRSVAWPVAAVARGDALQLDGRDRLEGKRRLGVSRPPALGLDQVEHALSGCQRLRELPRSRGQLRAPDSNDANARRASIATSTPSSAPVSWAWTVTASMPTDRQSRPRGIARPAPRPFTSAPRRPRRSSSRSARRIRSSVRLRRRRQRAPGRLASARRSPRSVRPGRREPQPCRAAEADP